MMTMSMKQAVCQDILRGASLSLTMLEYAREARRIYERKGGRRLAHEIKHFVRFLPSEAYHVLRGQRTVSINGVTATVAIPDRSASREIRYALENETDLLRILLDDLQESDVFLDVGSHIGLFAAFASEVAPDGRVIAVEPYPPNIDALEETVNRSNGAPIQIIRRPLSDRVEELALSTPDLPGTRGLSSIVSNIGGETIQVESTTGDELLTSGRIPQPNIVKIDVEGAEGAVINGMESLLRSSDCRSVYCEVHLGHASPEAEAYQEEIESNLSAAGFNTKTILDRGLEIQIVGRR